MYPRLAPGGFIIVDDYTDWAGCRRAIHEYRAAHGIAEAIFTVAHAPGEEVRGVYWRKGGLEVGGQEARTRCVGRYKGVSPPDALRPSKAIRLAPGDGKSPVTLPEGHHLAERLMHGEASPAQLFLCV